MQADFMRQTLNAAGAIMVDTSRATAHFELNGKSSGLCEDLQRALMHLAARSGSSIGQGNPHPLTQSPGTLSIALNMAPNNPLLAAAKQVYAGILHGGNCYSYPGDAPQASFMRSANAEDQMRQAEFLTRCMRMVATDKGYKPGRSLAQEIHDACALTAIVPSSLFDENAVIPAALFNQDAVKAHAVTLQLKRLAALYGATYSNEQVGRTSVGAPLYGHVIRGVEAVSVLKMRKIAPELTVVDHLSSAIKAEIAAWSHGIDDVPAAPVAVRSTGAMDAGTYWAADGSGVRAQDTFLGINLMGGVQPR